MDQPTVMTEGLSAGETWLCVPAPWGVQFELVTRDAHDGHEGWARGSAPLCQRPAPAPGERIELPQDSMDLPPQLRQPVGHARRDRRLLLAPDEPRGSRARAAAA